MPHVKQAWIRPRVLHNLECPDGESGNDRVSPGVENRQLRLVVTLLALGRDVIGLAAATCTNSETVRLR